MPGRVLRARWILPFVAVAAAYALWRNAHAPHWRELAPGVEFATIVGEPWCRLGSTAVAVLRVDPARVRLKARHYTRQRPVRLQSVIEWQASTRALAVFNAGQYYPDFRYMGVLVCDGDTVSARPHASFQAAFVARRGAGTVLDLARQPLRESRGWTDVAQSFMLFDHAGGVRVQRSSHIANRTAVGVDSRGWLVICVSEGAYTLADFAEMLQRSRLHLTHAMSMDGGLESELVVSTRRFRYASFGAWPTDRTPSAPGAQVPLPAVITVEPR